MAQLYFLLSLPFAAAELPEDDKPIPIQPLSVAFAELSGIPMVAAFG